MLVSFKSNYNPQVLFSQQQGAQNTAYVATNNDELKNNQKLSAGNTITSKPATQIQSPFRDWRQPDFKNTNASLAPKTQQYTKSPAPSKIIHAPKNLQNDANQKESKPGKKGLIVGFVAAISALTLSFAFFIRQGAKNTGANAGYFEKLREGFKSLFKKSVGNSANAGGKNDGAKGGVHTDVKNVLPAEEDYINKQECKTRKRAKNDGPKQKYVSTQLFSPDKAKDSIRRILKTEPDNLKSWEKDFLKSYNFTETIFDKLDNKEEISKALWGLRVKIAQWGCHSESEAESFARNMPLAIERFGIEGLQRLSEDHGSLNYKVSSLMFLDKPCAGINDDILYYLTGTFPCDTQRVLLKMSACELRDMSKRIATKLGNSGGAMNLNKEDIGLDYLINKADKEFFNKLNPEVSKALSGYKPYFAVNTDINKKESLLEKLQFIEKEFTSEELKKLSNSDEYTLKTLFAYINNDFNYGGKTGCYLNLPDELHSMAENMDVKLYLLRKKEAFLRNVEPSKLDNYNTELLNAADTVNEHFAKYADPDIYSALLNFRLFKADELIQNGSVDFSKYTKEAFERLEKRYATANIEDITKTMKGNKMLDEMLTGNICAD